MPRRQLDAPIRIHVDQVKQIVQPVKGDGSGERDTYFLTAIAKCWEKLDNVLPMVATNNREVRKLHDDCWKQFRGVRNELTKQLQAIEKLLSETTDDPDDLLDKQFYEEGGQVNYLELDAAVRSQGHREHLEFIADLDRYLRLVDAANIAGQMDPFERGDIYRHWVKRATRVNKFVRSFYRKADKAHREERDQLRAQKENKKNNGNAEAADKPEQQSSASDEQAEAEPQEGEAQEDEDNQPASKTDADTAASEAPPPESAQSETDQQDSDTEEQRRDGTRG